MTISHSGRPRSYSRRSGAPLQDQLSLEDSLHSRRCAIGQDELRRATLGSDTFDEESRRQRQGAEVDNNDDDGKDQGQPQKNVDDAVAALTTKRNNEACLSREEDERVLRARRRRPLSSRHTSLELGQGEIGCHSDDGHDGELSDTHYTESDEEKRRPRPAKRKRSSLPHAGPMRKKQKDHLQQRSTRQPRPGSRSHRHSLKSPFLSQDT